MGMLKSIAIVYCINAAILFVTFYIAGWVHFRKDGLGNGVKFGFLNVFLLSAFWPITAICIVYGMLYALVKSWKRL